MPDFIYKIDLCYINTDVQELIQVGKFIYFYDKNKNYFQFFIYYT